jgi:hypothetical protein
MAERSSAAERALPGQEDHQMGKFLLGLIIGLIVGILAMTVNPNLPQELRASLASLTAQVMRSAGETADDLGNAAEDLADEGERPDAKPPAATAPAAPADQTAPAAPADETGPANQGETRQPQ